MFYGEVTMKWVPPHYSTLNDIMIRVENLTVEKMNSSHKDSIREIIKLFKLLMQEDISNLKNNSAKLESLKNFENEQKEQEIDNYKEEIALLLQSKTNLLEKM